MQWKSYSNKAFTEDIFSDANNEMVHLVEAYFKYMLEPTSDEIYIILDDNRFINEILSNFTLTRMKAINDLQKKFDLIEYLEKSKP